MWSYARRGARVPPLEGAGGGEQEAGRSIACECPAPAPSSLLPAPSLDATKPLGRGTLYGWASRRPTSHADSTASHPSAADPHRQRSEPRPLGRRLIARATRVLRAARVRRSLRARAGAHGAP